LKASGLLILHFGGCNTPGFMARGFISAIDKQSHGVLQVATRCCEKRISTMHFQYQSQVWITEEGNCN